MCVGVFVPMSAMKGRHSETQEIAKNPILISFVVHVLSPKKNTLSKKGGFHRIGASQIGLGALLNDWEWLKRDRKAKELMALSRKAVESL